MCSASTEYLIDAQEVCQIILIVQEDIVDDFDTLRYSLKCDVTSPAEGISRVSEAHRSSKVAETSIRGDERCKGLILFR